MFISGQMLNTISQFTTSTSSYVYKTTLKFSVSCAQKMSYNFRFTDRNYFASYTDVIITLHNEVNICNYTDVLITLCDYYLTQMMSNNFRFTERNYSVSTQILFPFLPQMMSEELSDCPGKLHAVKCDLTKDAELLAMFDHVTRTYGPVHVCVNNAGMATGVSMLGRIF